MADESEKKTDPELDGPTSLDEEWAEYLLKMPGTDEQKKRGLAWYLWAFRTKPTDWFR